MFRNSPLGLSKAPETEMTLKRKRIHVEADAGCNGLGRDEADSNDEEVTITEEHYRSMVEEHAQKFRKLCLREAILARTTLTCAEKTREVEGSANGSIMQVGRVDRETDVEVTHPRLYSSTELSRHPADRQTLLSQKIGEDFEGQLPRVLDVGGIKFQIPSLYDRLAPALHLPDYSAVQIDERVFSGRIKSRSMVSVIASDRRAKMWKGRTGMGDPSDVVSRPKPGYYSERNAQDSQRRFSLVVLDQSGNRAVSRDNLEVPRMAQPSDAGGRGSDAQHGGSSSTLRHIASDGGLLRHCEVKVLEKGDGYEVIQRKVPRKEPAKIDLNVIAKEDAERFSRAWTAMIRKDLTKHHKAHMTFNKKQLQDAKRVAEACQREVRGRILRSLRVAKAAPMRTRRLCKETVLHWKKVDKEQIEIRKKEEKDAAEALKRDEEMREARRQQQRLNFLLTQTELYSHFMQDKMAGAGSQGVKGLETSVTRGIGDMHGPLTAEEAAEEENLQAEARVAVEAAVSQQKQKTSAFDSESVKLRLAAGEDAGEQEMMQLDGAENIDLVNPSTMPTTSSVQQPRLFCGSLKDYQLKGLQWLVNCYEQGLNGILADEMGLGKTIQAMSFLAHLAEEKNIWGPFLVVAPASVLNNWADEVGRFCPELKILPYWGGLQERIILRKNINPKRLYRKDAGFHILITSYQLLVQDEKYFRRVKWQYMVLDEAQAIKSAASLRWKTLLSFNCRNRLLLTGTPIQNSMAELWALLHFIMPTLFDSHEQFNEWFSKGIEGHAEHGGTLNEHQLSRLHSILKPFMLRRVKKDVITEMTNKKEVFLHCDLSSRQQAFYQAIKNKISVSDLLDGGQLNEKKVLNLMNIVIQLRKVCNHPELFERNEGRSFVHFAAGYEPLLPAPFGELEDIHYAGSRNPISYHVPKLLYRDGMRCLPSQSSGSAQGFYEKWLMNLFSIFSPDKVHRSIFSEKPGTSGTFGFTRLLGFSPTEVDLLAKATLLEQWLLTFWRSESAKIGQIMSERLDDPCTEVENAHSRSRAVQRLLTVPPRSAAAALCEKVFTGNDAQPFESLLVSCKDRLLHNLALLRSVQAYMPSVRAPQIELVCSDRGLAMQRAGELHDPWVKQWLVGLGRTTGCEGAVMPPSRHGLIQELDLKVKEQVQQPLLALPYRIYGSAPPVQSFDFAKMLADSGKLKTLDALLKRLRAGNHRVLVFAQMTKMLNVLEDYMNFRKYKYLRLDGSSTIMDRRDMVKDFQLRSDIFVFLLSTRAGGLGINLTAADVVIFYESDWNPTMDLQAMDRAHRLGQTKEVTVYRLICKGTVEEKIMKRASQKNTVQQLVMTGGQTQGDVFAAEEVVSLLLDDAELEKRMQEHVTKQTDKRKKGWGVGVKGVRLDDDGAASLDDDRVVSNSPGKPFAHGDPQSSTANGNGDLVGENGTAAGKKRRRGRDEGKPPRPPRKPRIEKEVKEPKAPKEPKVPKEPKAPKEPRVPKEPKAGKEVQRRSLKGKGPKVDGATSTGQPGRVGQSPEASEGSEPGGSECDLGAVEKSNNFELGRGAGRQKSKELAAVAGAGKDSSSTEGKLSTKSRTKVKIVVGKAANGAGR